MSQSISKASLLRDQIDTVPEVVCFLEKRADVRAFLSTLPSDKALIAKQLIAIGQLGRLIGDGPLEVDRLSPLLEKMASVDAFYRELGGILGYQESILKFLAGAPDARQSEVASFHAPTFIDITQTTREVHQAILWGIDAMPEMTEFYPLGGAADRLHLVDEETGSELPAAKLGYAGRTLFEGLIRDLQAREWLYFKIHGKQLETPVAVMTSLEKDNHRHVLEICEEFGWFGRKKSSFRLFTQPLVPAVDEQGNWCLLGLYEPLLKPGGHGALWKLARDVGVFQWLEGLGRKKSLIRQINNPIASLDYGLLAFAGHGVKNGMVFGFASCPRALKSAEGVNVVVEKKNGEIALTNIEYCDFAKYGIEDRPLKEGEPYSKFSSNTNILFADLTAVAKAVESCPFPGLLINLKEAAYTTKAGEKRQERLARLESTMQNIADVFVEPAEAGRNEHAAIATRKTFVTYNLRHKTISTAKKAFLPGKSVQETPEECFYVQLQAARELLECHAKFHLPPKRTLEEYLELGPDVLFLYHPALGPLYSLIAQKLRGGRLSAGSEFQAEISDLSVENLDLDGSLRILAKQPLGTFGEDGVLSYSDRTGRCSLSNVSVRNQGVNWMVSHPFWKHRLARTESLEIVLEGFSEFVAENVTFLGAQRFVVPDGVRTTVSECDGKLIVREEKLEEGPFWTYTCNERQEILAALRQSR